MEAKLKRVFKYSDKVYIVDAYLPDHLADNIINYVTINTAVEELFPTHILDY
jgi:hypothetical protein